MSVPHRRRIGGLDRSSLPDLYDYLMSSPPRRGRPPKHDLTAWRVTDDWPPDVPVTAAEVDVFEAWLGDVLDELFGRASAELPKHDELSPSSAACRDAERK